MKKYLLILTITLCAFAAKAQNASGQKDDILPINNIEAKKDSVQHENSEVPPEPVDGIGKYMTSVYSHVHYSGTSKGRVRITFTVEKDGSLSDIKVLKSLDQEADSQCIKAIKFGPKWKPGMQNGQPVRVQFTVPFSF